MALKGNKPLLKLKVEGTGVHAGRISVPDLVQICDKAQSAVHRQAEALSGQRTLRRGPVTADVKEECTLELVGISKGSAVLSFDLAKSQLSMAPSVGVEVVSQVVCTIGDLAADNDREYDPGVLDSLNGLGEVFERGSVRAIEWIVPRRNGKKKPVSAVYNKSVREGVMRRVKGYEQKPQTIEGTLEMADFKEGDEKCRIHPPIGNAVGCAFEKELEEEVYALLRRPVRVKGEASVDPHTRRVTFIRINRIEPLDPLVMGATAFLAPHSIEELARLQGVKPLEDVNVLAGGFPEDENIDEFLDDIYKHRETV
jgi:hypothetical protein